MAEKYLSPEELAARYDVSVETVYGWNKKGTGPDYIRAGKHVRYRPKDVDAWEERQFVASGTGRAGT